MRKTALEFSARGRLGVRDLGEPPGPGPSEILLETVYSGVTNGTERHAFLGEHGFGGGHYPSRHGYQQVGRVVAAGEQVTRFQTGDWVFYGEYVGHNAWNIAQENDLLLKLPEEIDRRYCALFGVAGVALRSVRHMGVRPGDNVLVVGQGPIGLFVGQAARAVGARVTVTDMLEMRLEAARKCGAHLAFNASGKNTERCLKQGGPYNYIYDCCSLENLLFDVHRHALLAHGGTIAMMAVRDTVSYPWSLLHLTEARLETSCHFDKDDLRVLLFLVQQGLMTIEPVVTHFVPIDEARRIYDLLANRDESLLGVIFDWSGDS